MTGASEILLNVHIACAVTCTAAFIPPLALRKGGPAHRRAGAACALLVLLTTGTSILLIGLAALTAGTARASAGSGLLDAMAGGDPQRLRLYLAFLAYIALSTAAAALAGLRALRGAGSAADALLHGALALAGLGFAAFGVGRSEPPVVLVGLAGAVLAAWNLSVARKRSTDPLARRLDHLSCMICSGIGIYSTVGVVVANRMIPEFLYGTLGLLVWAAPTLVGLPLILVLRRHYRLHPELLPAA